MAFFAAGGKKYHRSYPYFANGIPLISALLAIYLGTVLA
jgi:hypothetical protein